MRLLDYYEKVLMPANSAVSALRRAGLPIDVRRLDRTAEEWGVRLRDLEREVEGEAAARGLVLRYSQQHSVAPERLAEFLYRGLGLEPGRRTPKGAESTDDSSLSRYASISVPKDGDHPLVWKVLKIRSLSKALGTYARGFRDAVRADGCVHPIYNWALRTSRLSAENPPVHQIPEHSDREVADAIKSWMVPRLAPAPSPEDWDPRRHGSVLRWDIGGAEAAHRAAMLTHRFCSRPDPAWGLIRSGRDIHANTASLIYGRPEQEFRKGMVERDVLGKQTFFAKQFGAGWQAVQRQVRETARLWIDDAEAQRISEAFDRGHPGLVELYEIDKERTATLGYCEDGYGRRRWVGLPEGVRYLGRGSDGRTRWSIPRGLGGAVAHLWHVAANTPTQSMNATDCIWMIALSYHGEYVELRVPPMWERQGAQHSEAAGWRLHGGPGPGDRPFQAWYSNTVHDSAWGDCGPGYLEPFAKLAYRRCRALPFDWRLEADVPYRVDISVGPDFGHLRPYAAAAKEFGLGALE